MPRRSPAGSRACIKPFADPKIMAVGGFTVLGYDDLLSQDLRARLDFRLRVSGSKTVKRDKIHANNCAVRTDFFRENPFPDLPAFKKQCGFWLRDLTAKGYDYTRTADAMTVQRRTPATSSSPGAPGRWAWTAITRPSRPRPARASGASVRVQIIRRQGRQARGGGSGPAARSRPPGLAAPRGNGDHPRFLRGRPCRRDRSALTRSFEPLPKPRKAETAKTGAGQAVAA